MSVKLNSSGGGSVTLQEPSTASNRTLTLPDNTGNLISSADSGTVSQAMLGAGVAGNGPAFSAYQNTSQTLTASTYTKLAMSAKEYDTASCYNTSLYRFTPNVAGYYLVQGSFQITTIQATLVLAIYKNGSQVKQVDYKSGSSNAASGGAYIYLNGTTDYIELYGVSTSNNGVDVNSVNGWFQAALVRAA